MKYLILSLTALTFFLSTVSVYAQTESEKALQLNLDGSFRGYVNYTNQDGDFSSNAGVQSPRAIDIIRETEIMLSGETTLDNGLKVGANILTDVDAGDSFAIDESYIYVSNQWGRINLGDEDGAAYLLQVSVPSADDNVDGIRPKIRQFNGTGVLNIGALNYANSATKDTDKLTYITPKFSGFQAGATYTPTALLNAPVSSRGSAGNSLDGGAELENIYEIAIRYETKLSDLGLNLGAGYTIGSQETNTATNDDFKQWNVTGDANYGDFGLGVAYTENNNAHSINDKNETIVIGADYKVSKYKLGASYLNRQSNNGGSDFEIDRYAAGVQYSYATGMSLRSTIAYADLNAVGSVNDTNATILSIGTQINF